MTFQELMQMDRSLPPIVIATETGSRDEFMRKCTEARVNILTALKGLITDDSKARHGSANKTIQRIAVRVQHTLSRMYQIPSALWQRMDYKFYVAWAVHNAYVKCYATKDSKLATRDWTRQMQIASDETFHEVLTECYTMMFSQKNFF